jgi:hypothetical protein
MTRSELLRLVVQQAVRNGFDFKAWHHRALGGTWTSHDAALETLARGQQYFTLLFAHDFARTFWKHGSQIAFVVPSASYTRRDKDGKIVHIQRKPYTRRRLKPDAWKYHLREMAVAEEPLRYIRRFIVPAADAEATARAALAQNLGSAAAHAKASHSKNAASAQPHARFPAHLA